MLSSSDSDNQSYHSAYRRPRSLSKRLSKRASKRQSQFEHLKDSPPEEESKTPSVPRLSVHQRKSDYIDSFTPTLRNSQVKRSSESSGSVAMENLGLSQNAKNIMDTLHKIRSFQSRKRIGASQIFEVIEESSQQ